MKTSFSIGRALGDGLALIVRRPLAMLIWGVLLMLPTAISIAAFWPMFEGVIANPESAADMDFEAMMQMQGWSGLSNVASLVVTAVIGAAIIRAVLDPRLGQFGALRLSPQEFYYIVAQMVVAVGIGIIAVLLTAVGGALAFAVHGLPETPRVILWLVIGLLVLVALIWLWARSGLIGVASVARRDLAFIDGWTMTKAHAVGLGVMGVVSLLLSIVISLIGLGLAALPFFLTGIDWEALLEGPAVVAAPTGLYIAGAIACVVMAVTFGAATAVAYAPWASAYRQLTGDAKG